MHARELVELAALVAVHAPALVRRGSRVPQACVEQYWVAAKCRNERWLRLLRRLADAASELPLPATLAWPRVRPALEEILATELLTRLWTAASTGYDQLRGDQDLEPIARNIFTGHLEARRRLLQLLADGRVFEQAQSETLNDLRRRMERWNDMLLAHLQPLVATAEFAFDAGRASDFADDLAHEAANSDRHFTCQLMQVSLRASLTDDLADRSPNADLNRRLGSAVLGCFGDDLLEASGLLHSLWLERIHQAANDTQGMIDELVRMDAD